MRILALGCGTGDMWKGNLELLDNISEIILTDFSVGMLQSTQEMLGEKGIVEHISGLLKSYNVEGKLNKNFTLQNGKNILAQHFSNITKLEYEDELRVTNIEDMIDYIYSLSSMSNISNIERAQLQQILNNNMVDGVLHVPKEYGMFVCKNG